MGSSQSTKHEIPKSAYQSLYNRKNKSVNRSNSASAETNTDYQFQSCDPNRRVRSNTHEHKAPDLQLPATFTNSHTTPNTDYRQMKSCYLNTTTQSSTSQSKRQYASKLTTTRDSSHEIYPGNVLNDITIPNGLLSNQNQNVRKSLVKPPNRLKDLDDFIKNWNVWKEQFKSFLTVMDEKKEKYHEWGNILLHFMGPFGQHILNSLFFDNEDDKKNYVILMQKYNALYDFTTAVKPVNESTIKYIDKLKVEVVKNIKNVDKTLKEKIAKEIEKSCKERFIALAKSKLPNFQFDTTFNSLTLAEIAFLWEISEETKFNNDNSCKCCGKFHQVGKCLAFGKECNKCKRRNHYAKYCPGLMYIINCNFCGGCHESKHCPSYGEICSKCGKYNHFSWRCSKEIFLKNCRYCNQSHLMDRSICPAKSNLCSICKQWGHYEIKCNQNQNPTMTELNID